MLRIETGGVCNAGRLSISSERVSERSTWIENSWPAHCGSKKSAPIITPPPRCLRVLHLESLLLLLCRLSPRDLQDVGIICVLDTIQRPSLLSLHAKALVSDAGTICPSSDFLAPCEMRLVLGVVFEVIIIKLNTADLSVYCQGSQRITMEDPVMHVFSFGFPSSLNAVGNPGCFLQIKVGFRTTTFAVTLAPSQHRNGVRIFSLRGSAHDTGWRLVSGEPKQFPMQRGDLYVRSQSSAA